ncbi:Mobile element protein [Microcystis panniformis FACHB-1757]|uniref:Mobile element protein n=1 Tax=Microcystis panniformis FACHB-1757 TaxID=1638788 RepID=A0A0K1SAU9_9CHRO|nr:hypothetical protein [Microcystis panniformis]AKV71163.1 Mobile element protein [Microcystis panniformis FACHB-1757]
MRKSLPLTVESIKNTYAARRGKRKSRYGAKSKRGGIPGRVDILLSHLPRNAQEVVSPHPSPFSPNTIGTGKN